jgi:hypothetical protein
LRSDSHAQLEVRLYAQEILKIVERWVPQAYAAFVEHQIGGARLAYGIQLLLASAQRRRTVIGAARNRFKRYPEVPDEEAWYVPPYWRKSGSKRGKRYHLVPIVSWGAKAVHELDKLSDFEGSSGWLFVSGVPRSPS